MNSQMLLGGLQHLYGLQSFANDLLGMIMENPTCVPNCGKCCFQSCSSTVLEASFAVGGFLGFPQEKQELIIQKVEKWLVQPEPYILSKQASEKEKMERICPFLKVTDSSFRCEIYPWRPVHCRSFAITRAGQKGCMRAFGSDVLSPESTIVKELRFYANKLIRETLSISTRELARVGWFPSLFLRGYNPSRWKELAPKMPKTYRAYYFPTEAHNWIISQDDEKLPAKQLFYFEGGQDVEQTNSSPEC